MATQASPFAVLSKLAKYSDIVVALGIITIIIMMIIPLPPFLLDLLLSLNITFALVIIMVAVYNIEPLDFSVFPSLLLITTLFRLALNVSSTRLILLDGYAGEVIMAFGNFVVGGNAVVGFIIFV
ncbi:MAG: flagellar biosynthesis protein FlhA, partial [Firmicutes bacterium]|nr:flagellar biosynthesis protein FlhA [Bacillota bacterium]